MRTSTVKLLAAAAALAQAGVVYAAVSAEEAKQLGTTLTPWGAEVAGNKEGTIPGYTGGLTKPPPQWNKDKPGQRPDPFAAEKPLYSITANNAEQYADKLTEGSKALLKQYPTFRIDVYPTHRSIAFPKEVQDNTIKNATRCKMISENAALQDCYGGLPFPIAKNGSEMMWNVKLHFIGHATQATTDTWYVDGSGNKTLASENTGTQIYYNYAPNISSTPEKIWSVLFRYTAPARTAGEAVLLTDPVDTSKEKRTAYQYIPGQRRVKLAPDLSYDSPAPNAAGLVVMDQTPLFGGAMDRFDWKLNGKREIFLPYNNYKMGAGGDSENCNPDKFLMRGHWNPDCVRWELHRVWVVEATLKPGRRFIFSKRVFFLDEDGMTSALVDGFDASGQIYRMQYTLGAPKYDVPAPLADTFGTFDFLSKSWVILNWDKPGSKGFLTISPPAASFFSPDALAGTGIR